VSAVSGLETLDEGVEHARHLKLAVSDSGTASAGLVADLRARLPAARREVVHRYGGLVRTILIRLLGSGDSDRADRQDLLQDVFLRVFEGIDQLERPEALKAWVSRIAVFVAREHIRRLRRRRWLLFFGDPPDAPAPATAGEGLREAVRCVYALLARLPVDERLVLALHTFEGMELQEIAPMCGLSYATARRRLKSARSRFTKLARPCEALTPWMDQ
jgi:RNA polymerase sigma-70 factor, ECF subfamily